MASKKDSMAGIGIVDVAANVTAFEVMNNVQVELRMSVVDRRGMADVLLAALAHPRRSPVGEAPPLASVIVSCLGSNLTTMDAAIIHALYRLDSMLAHTELRKEG